MESDRPRRPVPPPEATADRDPVVRSGASAPDDAPRSGAGAPAGLPDRGTGPAVSHMFVDSAVGTVVGAVVGALLALPFGLISFGPYETWQRLLLVAVVGALAGSAVGFSLGGGRSDDDAATGLGPEDRRREDIAGRGGRRDPGHG